MDRGSNKGRKEDININKVIDKIGVKETMKYESIDIYVDANNKDNLWAIAHYYVYRRKKKIPKEQIIRFNNYNEMVLFLQNNFDTYELNNRVDYNNRSIFIHSVDYISMSYYLHDGRPDLNYIEIEYKEYVNDSFHIRKKVIPKEYEVMLLNIIKKNKNLDLNSKLDSSIYKEINFNDKKQPFVDEESKERVSRKERRLEKIKNQIPTQQKSSHKIRNIVLYASIVAVLTSGGIALVKNGEYKKEAITTENQAVTILDYNIIQGKDRFFSIISDLMINNYQNVSLSDLDFFFDYVKNVSSSNFDNNKSGTFFNYKDYFDSMIWNNNTNSTKVMIKGSEMLKNIEEKYRNCFKVVDNILILKEGSVKTYIDYVLSLTVMYDTIVDQRNSGQVPIENKYISSIYATKEEIEAYNQFPKVLKYVILSQLQDIIYHSNYTVTQAPSNYYGELDKLSLLNEVRDRMQLLEDSIKTDSRIFDEKTI